MQDLQGEPSPAGPGLRGAHPPGIEPSDTGARQPAIAVRSRPARGHGLRLDPAGRPGHRAFRWRVVCAQPRVLRSGEHREARARGRLQRGGLDARRARHGGAEVRAQDPVHPEAQSQRVPVVPEPVRSDSLRERQAGFRDGRARRGRDDLLRLRGIEAADPGSHRDVQAGPRAGHVHGVVVLPAGMRRSRPRTPTITSPPTSPARPITSA